jgi:MoaA/NifB/PqqE/SkfB family radical SAM enzyme
MMCKKICRQNGYGFAGFGVGSLASSDRNLFKPENQKSDILLSLCVNNVCHLGCEHCVAKNSRESTDNFEVVAEKLMELKPEGLEKITFASFASLEPLEMKTPDKIIGLADFFHQKNIQTILMTNGIKLDSRMQKYLAGRIDFLDPSIDGLRGACKPALQNGGYSDAWTNIKTAINSGFAKKTGIIVTARDENIEELPDLFRFFKEELSGDESTCSTLWFYLGADLLPKDSFMRAVKAAIKSPYRQMQIAVPGDYNHYIPDIFTEFGPSDLRYCSQTGIPSFLAEDKKMLFPGLTGGGAALLRIEINGDIYLGCGHLHGSRDNFLGPIECLSEIISSF